MSQSLPNHVKKGQLELRADHIKFDRIPLDIFIGADPEELSKRQRILVSMDLRVSPRLMKRAARTDQLKDAVDFLALVTTVQQTAEKKQSVLLETLAEEIAAAVLAGFPIKGLGLLIQKPNRYGTLGGIGVEIDRTQPRRFNAACRPSR